MQIKPPIMTYYDQIAPGYDELHREEQLKKLNFIAKYIKLEGNGLDVGCGTGVSTSFFKCGVGVDPSEELLKIAKKNYPEIKFIKANAEKLPFKDNEFDFVVSITAIQNFDNIEKGLKEIKRVGKIFVLSFLKKSGRRDMIEKLIKSIFDVKKKIEEEKDIFYVCL
jgi:ubiquinone/menaquinone biosynthesis C-methylase UbiE